MREALRRPQERTSLGLFPELKRRNRARDEPPLIGHQKIGKSGWNTTRILSVVFEVIQPDLEINRSHAATPLIRPKAAVCEPVRAVLWRNSGKFWQWCRVGELHDPTRRTPDDK